LKAILKIKSLDINILQRFIDPFALVIIFFLIKDNGINFSLNYLLLFFINLTILSFHKIYKSYRIKNINETLPNILSASCATSIFSSYLLDPNNFFKDTNFIKLLIISICYLFFHHYLIRAFLRVLRVKGFNSKKAVFLGNKQSFQKVFNQTEKYPWLGYKITHWFSPNKIDYENKELNSIFPLCSGGIDDLINLSKVQKIEKLFFCLLEKDDLSFNKLLKILGDLCVSVSYIIPWESNSISLKKEYFGDMIALNIWNPENSIIKDKIKRLFDLMVSFLALIILLPFFIIISVIIKSSSHGPIFFIQKRYGLNGNVFKMYKFRTMHFEEDRNQTNLVQAKLNDKRITIVGKFLRKYSLDELPQLINVIKGEMSLVGPRPHANQHNEYYRKLITGYMQRHSKLPGMTGLAQIKGYRGETSKIELMKLRVNYDLEYNNNWNLSKDFLILIKTIFVILKGNSY